MAEYIEGEEALNLISDIFLATDPNGEEQCGVIKCSKAIRKAPAADVVEVVRCKDCVHWSEKIGMCLYCYGLHYNAINPSRENNFCSYGERRSDE